VLEEAEEAEEEEEVEEEEDEEDKTVSSAPPPRCPDSPSRGSEEFTASAVVSARGDNNLSPLGVGMSSIGVCRAVRFKVITV
jgi:hypothetical protein